MSAGHHHAGEFPPGLHKTLEQLSKDGKFKKAVGGYTRLDDSHDVPFVGSSNEKGDTVYIDRHFAAAIKDGKIKYKGREIDPTPLIHLHEAVEGALRRTHGISYDKAHALASAAEKAAAEHMGLDWAEYQKAMKPFIGGSARENVSKPPSDLVGSEPAEREKFTHAEVKYGPGKGNSRCVLCVHYDRPHCEIVQDPIKPDGWCERFSKRK